MVHPDEHPHLKAPLLNYKVSLKSSVFLHLSFERKQQDRPNSKNSAKNDKGNTSFNFRYTGIMKYSFVEINCHIVTLRTIYHYYFYLK